MVDLPIVRIALWRYRIASAIEYFGCRACEVGISPQCTLSNNTLIVISLRITVNDSECANG